VTADFSILGYDAVSRGDKVAVVSKDPSAFTQSTDFLDLPDPENEGNTAFRDAGNYSPHDQPLHPKKTFFVYSAFVRKASAPYRR
jgi:hypothetical protein